jgi:glycine dehydrogenase subunit 1
MMLSDIGVSSCRDLFSDIPEEARLGRPLNLPPPLSEWELVREMEDLASGNRELSRLPSFLGAGVYRHFIPSVVDSLISRSEFYTAYTPYQAEVSQGTLQAIYEFQTMICRLTGMDAANASMYDGASALAEAAVMALGASSKRKILVSRGLHPEYRRVLKTYLETGGKAVIREIPLRDGLTDREELASSLDGETAAFIIQNPNFLGCIEDGPVFGEIAREKGVPLLVGMTEPVSLGLLRNPGSCGAAIVAGEGSGLGLPPSFGGPSLGFLASRNEYLRRMPGRLAGRTVDLEGRTAYVLTLQAREQHIRREKAVSNICSNEALCALAATIHLAALGKEGFRQVSELSLRKAHHLKDILGGIPGFGFPFEAPFFNEFVLRCPADPGEINAFLLGNGVVGGYALGRDYPELSDCLLLCATELTTRSDMEKLAGAMRAGGDLKFRSSACLKS